MLVILAAALSLSKLARASANVAVASSYSAESSGSTRQGCSGAPPLRDGALSVATFLVGCGQRLRICLAERCVVVTRWDSGPYVEGRGLDLNVGVVRALGFSSAADWGVRTVTWSPAVRIAHRDEHEAAWRRRRRHARRAGRPDVLSAGPLVVFEPLPHSALRALFAGSRGRNEPSAQL